MVAVPVGLSNVRVRYHKGDLARLEVPLDAIAQLCAVPLRNDLLSRLKAVGFKYVTLDLEGFRSGSMNAVLPIESLRMIEAPSNIA